MLSGLLKRLPLLILLLLGGAGTAGAQEVPEASGAVFTARLARRPMATYLHIRSLDGSVSFKALPAECPADAVMGAVPTGEASGEFIGYAFDKKAGRIWVDVNQNLDLTDDPAVGIGNIATRPGSYLSLTDIEIEMPGDPARRYLLNLVALPWGAYADITSGWTGFVDLPTGRYPLAVLDDLDGVIGEEDILLMGFRDDAEPLYGDRSGIYVAVAGRGVFIDGRQYDLVLRFESGENGADLIAEFRETAVPMAEADVTGQFILRLVFRGERGAVFLDRPSGRAAVPAGPSTLERIYLDSGEQGRRFEGAPGRLIHFDASAPASITEGAPLKNTLELRPGLSSVHALYRLVDATGVEYLPSDRARAGNPSFVVYKNGRQIASANFEYG